MPIVWYSPVYNLRILKIKKITTAQRTDNATAFYLGYLLTHKCALSVITEKITSSML